MPQHIAPTPPARRHTLQLIAAGVATAVLVGAGGGVAAADPGGQGGVTDGPNTEDGGGQGGVTDTAPASPAPPTAPGPRVSPVSPGSPGIAPAPPPGPAQVEPSTWEPSGPTVQQQPSAPSTTAPSYPNAYTPIPQRPLHTPRAVPDVPRQQWQPNTLTVGNLVVPVNKLPVQLQANPRLIVSANDWSAYAASQIARGLISIGVPKDAATRQAAAAVIGAVAGGAIGGTVAFTTTAVVVGVVTIPLATLAGTAIGAGIGSLVPPQPGNLLPGALIGAGAGAATGVAITAASAVAAGVAGAAVGATLGGLTTWALGTGDPGRNLRAPSAPRFGPEAPRPHRAPPPPPAAASGGNQFELAYGVAHLDRGASLTYDVNRRGAVSGQVTVGGQHVQYGWSAAQANQAYTALGPNAAAVKRSVTQTSVRVATQLQKAVPGLSVKLPPLPTPAAPRHHRAER